MRYWASLLVLFQRVDVFLELRRLRHLNRFLSLLVPLSSPRWLSSGSSGLGYRYYRSELVPPPTRPVYAREGT
jgi:hypothetical protein